jgi:hypothetical protein
MDHSGNKIKPTYIASMMHGCKTAAGKPSERDHLGDLGVHGGRILKQLSKKQIMMVVTGLNCRNRKVILILSYDHLFLRPVD